MPPSLEPTVFQVNVSRNGFPKHPIREAEVGINGITTDFIDDGRHKNSIDHALCLFGIEVLATLRAEGHPVDPGSTGENITTLGLNWRHVVPGMRMWLGEEVEIEVTGYADPGWKHAHFFKDGLYRRISHEFNPGSSRVYARVLQPGTVHTGDVIRVVDESPADRAWRSQPYTIRWPQDYAGSVVGNG